MKQVTVTWGSKKYQLDLDETAPVSNFLQLLYQTTGVPIERQKLLLKHKRIQPDSSWNPNEISDGLRFMLIGTAEPIVEIEHVHEENRPGYQFSEEEEEEEKPVGLKNFGNTCYLNSVLQVFRYLSEFQNILMNTPNYVQTSLTQAMIPFFKQFPYGLDLLVGTIRRLNPAFAQQDPTTGSYQQQDAGECWSFLMNELNRSFPQLLNLFNIEFKISITNIEDPEDTEVISEVHDKLQVNISSTTDYLEQGVSMESEITKFSQKYGKDCIFTVHKAISNLPKYLVFQMMRFCYKKEEDVIAKVVRRVKSPFRLNVLDWTTPELRSQIVNSMEKIEKENKKNDKDSEENQENDKNDKIESSSYELLAIITHKGRSANSGHYVSHVRIDDQWYRLDDEKVIEIDTEKVEELSGGADWHCSYILVYEKQPLHVQ